MTEPRIVDPLEALHLLTQRHAPKTPRRYELSEAPNGYLATAVRAVEAPTPPRAALNGYALGSLRAPAERTEEGPGGLPLGDLEAGASAPQTVLGTLTASSLLSAAEDFVPAQDPAEAPGSLDVGERERRTDGVYRVETGAPLPPGTVAVVPVEQTVLVATDQIRILSWPSSGDGILRTTHRYEDVPGDAADLLLREGDPDPDVFLPGTRFCERLRLSFLAAGKESVELWEPFRVGIAAVGDELLDVGAPPAAGTRSEVNLAWLEAAVERLGLGVVPCGIVSDAPDSLGERIVHATERKVRVLVLIGGLGSGTTDRVREALSQRGAHIVFERVDLDGCEGFLYARSSGLEILGLSGQSLAAACGFDVLARPALLARLGASPSNWDWSRLRWPLANGCLSPPPAASEAAKPASWKARPAALEPFLGGGCVIQWWSPRSRETPCCGGQEGWALLPPGGPKDEPPTGPPGRSPTHPPTDVSGGAQGGLATTVDGFFQPLSERL
jgi:molybdopterin molybdotransferase